MSENLPLRKTIIEPFKIKSVEPLPMTSRAHREKVLGDVGYNLFLLQAQDVTFDFLTDSGTTAMSSAQWGAMMVADEVYAGSQSFRRFKEKLQGLTGYDHVIPTHQGRAAEKLLFSVALKKGDKIPSNNHFDTTRANIEYMNAEAIDLVIEEGRDPKNPHPFKGNMDLQRLENFCKEHQGQIPLGMLTITNNTGGGQPVSLENIEGVAKIYQKYNIPFIMDVCRFAENSYFIKLREEKLKNLSVREIAQRTFALADGCMMSAKKDALVNIGGFIAMKEKTRSGRDLNPWVEGLRNMSILTEGFPTYGGLAARDLEAMTVGLDEALDENYLAYRIAVSRYMAEGLNSFGIPTLQPPGGHAVYIDAKSFLPHIPTEQFPGQSLAIELYLSEGVRSCEIGSVMFGKSSKMELVRLAFPRRVYTQSHFDYILEGAQQIAARKSELRGYKIVKEPPFLRHFTCRFSPL